ncbi:uncharacterized protein UV8b_03330 [Ustilaginoidea virens]|uniref:Nucleotide sugar dehydrogenase n=1 Tax=Ustilaginoidea virens TaxID=1159556 RepID=A0A8E5HPE4_USTVR|nr:uncharacterized protein UV8b_03330 [Ustilaginoidea virens]QUC19089.1 hypothetical protein UV8b_03330 [Ustilaginoidea virens]
MKLSPFPEPLPSDAEECSTSFHPRWTHYSLTPPSESPDRTEVFPPVQGAPASVAVIGVGYVGQHLVATFSKAFAVIGYDVSQERIDQVRKQLLHNDQAHFTTSAAEISQATYFLIAVPTLLRPDKSIDSSSLRDAVAIVSTHARPGSTVVIESSVAVGMTRALLGPLAASKGFYAGMSPERVDPGRSEPAAHAIPKIVAGLDDVAPGSLETIKELYSSVFDELVPVSSPEVAEMTKLYENCQRMLCIAYANEMADACVQHGIDAYEVCHAAATKPFGYMSFVPGLGVGGHCIPVNPYYLLSNSNFPLLRAASDKMAARPRDVARRIVARFSAREAVPRRPRVLVVGMGFKPGQCHLANSPGLELARSLVVTAEVQVMWVDPLVPQDAIPQIPRLEVQEWSVPLLDSRFDLVVVAFRQHGLDWSLLNRLQVAQVEMWCP